MNSVALTIGLLILSLFSSMTARADCSNVSDVPTSATGLWLWSRVNSNDGTTLVTYFEMLQDGERVDGHVEYSWGGAPHIEGRMQGNCLSFRLEGDLGTLYTGVIDGTKMSVTVHGPKETSQMELVRLPLGSPKYGSPATLPELSSVASNELASTPPMGWNAWNHFHDYLDDKTVREIVQSMISSGMRDAGYVYVNIDDEWSGERDITGQIQSNRNFPDMKRLAEYVHSNGMKIGLYSSPGPQTCEGHLGSLGHESADALVYASWGIDYLKYDWCSAAFVYSDSDMRQVYQRMGTALRNAGRPIVYSLCQYGKEDVWKWGGLVGGNLWRTTPDIQDKWSSVQSIWDAQKSILRFNKPGGWNDPDMLEVGNGGMSEDEYRAHFTLWAFLAAPLIAGNDPRTMSKSALDILTNKDVIAIDQDSLVSAPQELGRSKGLEVWLRELSNNEIAILLVNFDDVHERAELVWDSPRFNARDLWRHEAVTIDKNYDVELVPHTVKLLRMSRSIGVPRVVFQKAGK